MPEFVPTREKLIPDLSPREELVVLARTLVREGYDDHLAGHITMRQDDGSLLCNPWFITWDELRPEHVIRIDLDGKVLEGDWPAPLGIPLHLELHRRRHDVGVALHHHPRWGTVWADLGRVPPCHDQSSALGGGTLAVVDEYDGPASDRSAAASAVEAMGDADMALLVGHGVFVTAKNVRAAHQRAVALEQRCQRAWAIQATGLEGKVLPDAMQELLGWGDGDGFRGFWEAMVRRVLRDDPTLLDDR